MPPNPTSVAVAPAIAPAIDPADTPARPWHHFPIVWMVVAGPALVVVAAVSTAVIAWTHIDPLLDTSVAPTHAPAHELPALQARNHAADNALAPAER